MVALLVKSGADVNARDLVDRSPCDRVHAEGKMWKNLRELIPFLFSTF